MYEPRARARSAKLKKCCDESVFVTNETRNYSWERPTSSSKTRNWQCSLMAASGTAALAVSQEHDGTESGGTTKSSRINVEIGVWMHDCDDRVFKSCTFGNTTHTSESKNDSEMSCFAESLSVILFYGLKRQMDGLSLSISRFASSTFWRKVFASSNRVVDHQAMVGIRLEGGLVSRSPSCSGGRS